MILQILSHTPVWVFGLLLGLLGLGLMQARTRSVRKAPALLFPAGMIALSVAGIHWSFGFTALAVASWFVAAATATACGYAYLRDKNVLWQKNEGKFFIPGSWVPLAVMMTLFSLKYVHAVMKVIHPDSVAAPVFIGTLSAVYGLLSGYFSARAANLITLAVKD